MKQSKSLQYLLLGLVAIIWGAISYQIWQYLKSEDGGDLYASQQFRPKLTEASRDTFSLSLNYPDPFTGQLSASKSGGQRSSQSSRSSSRASVPQTSPTEPEPEVKLPAPAVEYIGYSINNNQVSRVRLRVDGSSVTYRLNEAKAGLAVIAMQRDSVTINRSGEQFVFYRKE
ncbi:MAG: hypothetical protein AAFN81_09570 [Bacteroidota bacterium]